MKLYKTIILSISILLFANSCSDDTNNPLEKDGTPPAPVSNPVVENLSGAARISYNLPSDPDLLYVVAKYTNKQGKTMEFKSSYYTNTVLVEGFGDTDDYKVELYAVDRSENMSAVVEVVAKPLTPPVQLTYNSLEVIPDFGGISVIFKNEAKADISITVVTPDSVGDMVTADVYYTARDSAKFSVRGYKSELRTFGVFIRDRWGNQSQTLLTDLVPIYEVELDKSKFREVILPGDAPVTLWGGAMTHIWDGKFGPEWDGGDAAHTGNIASGVPKYFTFDMGVEAQLSRFTLYPVCDDKHFYNDVSPRLYEIWGCITPDPSGSFDGWTKLVTVENVKPSGLPVGILTEDDRIAGWKGDEANFPLDAPKVRYIRIRCLNNWAGNTNMVFSEITFWGNDQ